MAKSDQLRDTITLPPVKEPTQTAWLQRRAEVKYIKLFNDSVSTAEDI
jgi:hypothetical protein